MAGSLLARLDFTNSGNGVLASTGDFTHKNFSRELLLLYGDGQIHAYMNSAVKLESASSRERADWGRAVAADVHIVDRWCTSFPDRSGCIVHPCAIRDNVRAEGVVIDKRDTLPFFESD